MTETLLTEYLDFAKSLAHDAGVVMKRYFRAQDLKTEWKKDNTPLTIADTTINQQVIDRVKAAYPEHGILGEEASYEPKRQLIWVVDPIDGTMPFSLGLPLSMFSLALVDRTDGQAVIGVAYDPQLDHMYTAARGLGAHLNDTLVQCTNQTKMENTYSSVLGGMNPKNNFKFLTGKCSDLMRELGNRPHCLYSQVYSATRVASGEFITSIFGFGSAWDSAAVSVIVEEAGGVVTNIFGKPRRYDGWGDGCILSANPTIHRIALKVVSRCIQEK